MLLRMRNVRSSKWSKAMAVQEHSELVWRLLGGDKRGKTQNHHKEAVRHMCLEASRLKQRARTNWKPASSQATGSQPIKECSARGNSPFMGGCLKSPTRLHGGYSLRSFLRMLNGLVRMQDIESCHFEAKHEIFAIT